MIFANFFYTSHFFTNASVKLENICHMSPTKSAFFVAAMKMNN